MSARRPAPLRTSPRGRYAFVVDPYEAFPQAASLFGWSLTDCASVVLVRSFVPGTVSVPAPVSVDVVRSNVHAFDCTFEGGSWFQGLFFDAFGAYLGTPSLLLVLP